MSGYRECHHTAQLQGQSHRTVFASIEFPLDSPPPAIEIEGYRWVLETDRQAHGTAERHHTP